jgi:hypothetical protein
VIQIAGQDDYGKRIIRQAITDDELADYYNKLRMQPTSVNPLVIDNETGEPVHEDAE